MGAETSKRDHTMRLCLLADDGGEVEVEASVPSYYLALSPHPDVSINDLKLARGAVLVPRYAGDEDGTVADKVAEILAGRGAVLRSGARMGARVAKLTARGWVLAALPAAAAPRAGGHRRGQPTTARSCAGVEARMARPTAAASSLIGMEDLCASAGEFVCVVPSRLASSLAGWAKPPSRVRCFRFAFFPSLP